MKKTCDTLFDGKLVCKQHEQGYRFSVDAVLLAGFYKPKKTESRVLDLCCGCGVVGLILAYRFPELKVLGFEMQVQLVALAESNIKDNGFVSRMKVVGGNVLNVRSSLQPESFDVVVCNPPYRKENTGRVNLSDEAALARHETGAILEDFVSAAAFCVKNRGRVIFVYPASRLGGLITTFQNYRLYTKKMQLVYSYPDDMSASLVVLEAVKNGGEECEVLPPLYVYTEKNGEYSTPMQAYYR